jgi:phosphate:Na+ symporter
MGKSIERKQEEKIWFNQHQRMRLEKMFDLIDQAFVLMKNNLNSTSPQDVSVALAETKKIENAINIQRDLMRKESNENLNTEGFNVYSALIYNNLFSALERIGDHIEKITEAILYE